MSLTTEQLNRLLNAYWITHHLLDSDDLPENLAFPLSRISDALAPFNGIEASTYEQRVSAMQREGMSRGDAQGVIDAEDMQRATETAE